MIAASDADSAGPSEPTRRARSGRASILVSLAIGALAALALLVWLLRPSVHEPPRSAGPRATPPAEQAEAPGSPALRLELGLDEQPERPTERTPREQRPLADPRTRFAGTGVLEGHLRLPPGVLAPRAWSLVAVPSKVLIGGEHAAARRVEFSDGELEFTLRDLPLGGYEVWAEAEGMTGRHEHLLLARPDAMLVDQDLRLTPLAYVEGRVLDDEGVGVPGLPMHLRPLEGGARLETRADGTGHYLFERVPDGGYLLEAGFADAPLATPLELAVVSPSLHVPTIEVPRLHELVALVLDDAGAPLAGARVRGWCNAGGRVEALSDATGLARQPWIPAGRLTLEAVHGERPELGHARVHVDFPPPDGAAVELRLRR